MVVNSKKNNLNKKNPKNAIKDNPLRSFAKTISWRIIATGTTFLISYFVFSQDTRSSMDENIEKASLIASIEFFSKFVFYYFHERLWTNINWGKFWKKKRLEKIRKRRNQELLSRQKTE